MQAWHLRMVESMYAECLDTKGELLIVDDFYMQVVDNFLYLLLIKLLDHPVVIFSPYISSLLLVYFHNCTNVLLFCSVGMKPSKVFSCFHWTKEKALMHHQAMVETSLKSGPSSASSSVWKDSK